MYVRAMMNVKVSTHFHYLVTYFTAGVEIVPVNKYWSISQSYSLQWVYFMERLFKSL